VDIFSEPTADALLRALRPSVYVKGADYTEATLPEAETARALGIQIALLPLVPGRSSSALAQARTTLLTVFAHPDDESFGAAAAVAAQRVAAGAQLHGLWFTRGEHGQTSIDPPPSAHELARLREQDLREVAALIGYHSVDIRDYEDGTLDQVTDLEELILAKLRELSPSVVLTFGPAGITRHADHMAVHRATTSAFQRARTDGVPVRELYYDAVPNHVALRMGIADEPDGNPNTLIDVAQTQHFKISALRLHARHIADAAERLAGIEQRPQPVETLFRAWPPVPPGVTVRAIDA
jgi:LmbE family N-acetylglucosaminyl deacetylase